MQDHAIRGGPGHLARKGASSRKPTASVERPFHREVLVSCPAPAVRPDLAAEQAYLDRAHDHLADMQSTATRLADRFRITAGDDFNDAAVEHAMRRYRATLDVGGTLCFGRIDDAHGDRWYVGRRHVEDRRGR